MSEFDKIIESYANFMMSKIIANTNDLVGLILYNIVILYLMQKGKDNCLNFENIVVAQKLDLPSAKSTKSAKTIKKDFV